MSKLKYGMATASVIAAFVGVAGLSLPQVQAGDDVMGIQVSDFGTQRARIEFEVQKQECGTLKNSQPQAYDPCLQKARSTRDNLLTQAGSAPAGQGSQGFGSNQSQQQFSRQEEQGPIDKMTSAVKETVAEVKEKLFGSSDESQQQGQGGQGQQWSVTQGQNPLQQGFEAQHMQGSGQGGQSFGQQGQSGQGSFQGGQQPQGQSGQGSFEGAYSQQPQGQSGQGSFQGGQQPQGQSGQGSFQGGQQPQGQSGQGSFGQHQSQSGLQGTGGTNAQFQSGGAQEAEHMDAVEYYKVLAQQQYGTLKQECDTLKQDRSVWEQCQQHAKSVRDKIAGMARQGT